MHFLFPLGSVSPLENTFPLSIHPVQPRTTKYRQDEWTMPRDFRPMIFLNQTGDKENIPNLQADIGGGELIRTL